jgi:hypothetical protein
MHQCLTAYHYMSHPNTYIWIPELAAALVDVRSTIACQDMQVPMH